MSTALGEVIELLGFNGTIPFQGIHETNKVILQEFSSISVTVFSNEKVNLTISFSNDGINFDYSATNVIEAVSPQTVTSIVIGKWCKLLLRNASGFAAQVRLSTYCSTQPSTVQSSINSIDDAFQFVNIGNWSPTLNNEIRIAQDTPISSHKFYYSSVAVSTVDLNGPDNLFKFYNGGGLIPGGGATHLFIDGGIMKIADIYKSPVGAWIYGIGDPVNFRGGNPISVTFSSIFDDIGYLSPVNQYDNFLIGMGYADPTTGNISDGVFIGYPSTGSKILSLIYYNNGVQNIISKNDWIFDSLDGNGPSRIIVQPFTLNEWRIRTSYLGASSIFLEFHSPTNNEYIPCHRIQLSNISTFANFSNPSFSFMVYARRTTTQAGAGVNNVFVGSAAGNISVESGTTSQAGRIRSFGIGDNTTTLVANTETPVLGVRAGELLNGKVNRSNLLFFKLSFATDGTKPVVFKVYTALDTSFTLPTWNYSPSQTVTPAQLLANPSSFNFGVGSVVVFTVYASKVDARELDLREFIIKLYEGESIVITAESSNASDVSTALTYGLIE